VAQLAAELTPLASARHFLGAELRHWRCLRGMSLATLGRAVHVTGSLLARSKRRIGGQEPTSSGGATSPHVIEMAAIRSRSAAQKRGNEPEGTVA
jgi:hypothetical protein